jgi:PAS domain S-box-containing protein
MSFIDMRTVIFIMLTTNIICTLVLILLWLQNRRHFAGTGLWAADFVFQVLGLLLIILRNAIPDLFSIVLGNTLAIAGALLGYMGLERFVGKKGTQVHNYLLLAIFPLVHAYFTFVQPSLAMRTLNVASALLILCFQCMWLLLHRIEPAMRPLTRGVGIVFGIYCLVNLARIVAFFTVPNVQNDFFSPDVSDKFALVFYQILFVLLTYGLMLMVNKRLLMEVRSQEEKFSKAFHLSPYAISLTRLSDGRIFEVNDFFTRITGYSVEEIMGKTTIDLNLWSHDEDRNEIVRELTSKGSASMREVQFKKKSGDVTTVLLSAELIDINGLPCILSSIADITDRKIQEQERERLIKELQGALSEVKTLSGLLPICASCKKIRDDSGYWNQLETYISRHSSAEFSHGICPECARKLYPELFKEE